MRKTLVYALGLALCGAARAAHGDAAPWAFTAPAFHSMTGAALPSLPLDEGGLPITPQEQVLRHVRACDQFSAAQDWDAATREIREALRLAPGRPELLARAANLYMMLRDYAAAEQHWTQLASALPHNAWARAGRGAMLLRLRQFDAAQTDLARALNMDPTDMVARFHLAWVALMNGNEDGARASLNNMSLLDLAKATGWVRDEADVMNEMLGETSFRLFCELLLTSGERAEAEWHREMAALSMEALRSRMAAIAADAQRAYAAILKRQWREGLSALTQALRNGARAPALINDLAFCHYHLGEIAEATSYMNRLASLYPSNSLVIRKYGVFCLETEQFEKAEQFLAKARELSPRDTDVLLNLAGAYAARTNFAAAWVALNEIPAERRRAHRAWFDQDKPYAKALRTDARYAAWAAASTP